VDECKALPGTSMTAAPSLAKRCDSLPTVVVLPPPLTPTTRGLHSSTFRLNLSAFCGIEVCLGIAQGVFRRCQGGIKEYQGEFRVYLVSETAQVQLMWTSVSSCPRRGRWRARSRSASAALRRPRPRALHSFTFQLNVSTFCGLR